MHGQSHCSFYGPARAVDSDPLVLICVHLLIDLKWDHTDDEWLVFV